MGPAPSSEVMTASTQQALTPADVLADLKEGNLRFVEGRLTHRDYLAQVAATSKGQYPKAVVVSCLDSRVPPEIVFDQGIGDLFVGRIAGNFENTDLLGSLEFATKAAGSKLIVVLGHTSCGAVKGALDGVELGNLTEMLHNLDEVVAEVRSRLSGPPDSSNAKLVQAAVERNVYQTVDDILTRSPIIAEMVDSGELAVVGGVYDLATGRVEWLVE
jgi:carbonic anhydrase